MLPHDDRLASAARASPAMERGAISASAPRMNWMGRVMGTPSRPSGGWTPLYGSVGATVTALILRGRLSCAGGSDAAHAPVFSAAAGDVTTRSSRTGGGSSI